MNRFLDPQFLLALLVAILGGIVWALKLLYRIGKKVGDTQRQVDTLWQWWLLHVGKIDLPKGDDGTKRAGFTAEDPH